MRNINIDTIDPIEDFPRMIERGDDFEGMDTVILQDMREYIEMEKDPVSYTRHDLFDRETLSIAFDIKARYNGITNPSPGDQLAFMWANRKMGLDDVSYTIV